MDSRSTLFITSVLAAVISCSSPASFETTVLFQDDESVDALMRMTESIDLIPLETDASHFLGFSHDLFIAEDGTFVISDIENGNIYRYSKDGSFLNSIGQKGNGPAEYVNIYNIQVSGNSVYVYTRPKRCLEFTLSGEFVNSMTYDDMGTQSFMTQDGLLTYFGYGSGRGHRFGLYTKNGSFFLLPSTESVINMTANIPIFREYQDKIFIADSYNSTVMTYADREVSPYLSFDFGKYAIPEDFFSQTESMRAMEILMSSPFAMVNTYQESSSYSYVEVNIQSPKGPKRFYGLNDSHGWSWFSLGELGVHPLAGQMSLLRDNCLYGIAEPSLLGELQKDIQRKVNNTSIIKSLTPESNNVIVKINLK